MKTCCFLCLWSGRSRCLQIPTKRVLHLNNDWRSILSLQQGIRSASTKRLCLSAAALKPEKGAEMFVVGAFCWVNWTQFLSRNPVLYLHVSVWECVLGYHLLRSCSVAEGLPPAWLHEGGQLSGSKQHDSSCCSYVWKYSRTGSVSCWLLQI